MLKRAFLGLVLSCITLIAIAAQSPVTMLETASNSMIDALKQHRTTIKSDPRYVENLVRQILLPHVEAQAMARLALGRDGWQQATPEQRQQFTAKFTTLMIRTYSAALASYTNQSVKFYPVRGGISTQKQLQIDSKILQPGGPAIPMSYRVVLQGDNWKVYDMSVDGVSMVQSFRSQFAQELKRDGVTGLLTAMDKMSKNGAKS